MVALHTKLYSPNFNPNLMRIFDLTELRATSIQLSELSLSVGSLSFSMPDFPGAPEFAWRDRVRITHNGRPLIEGIVTDVADSSDGTSAHTNVTVSDYWWVLDNSPYAQSPGYVAGGQYKQPSVYIGAPGKGPVADAINQVIDAIHFHATIHPDWMPIIDFELNLAAYYRMLPFAQSAASFAEVLREIQRWVPSLTSRWDYSGARPKLVFSATETAEQVQLHGQAITAIDLKPRPDLIPPVVAIISKSKAWDGSKFSTVSIAPRGGDVSTPGAIYLEVSADDTGRANDPEVKEEIEEEQRGHEAQDLSYDRPKMVIKGDKIPQGSEGTGDIKWWEKHFPLLNKTTALKTGACTVTPQPAPAEANGQYDAAATKYELVEGMIDETMTAIKWCDTEVEQAIMYTGGTPPVELKGLFPIRHKSGHYFGYFRVVVRTINCRRKTYILNGEGTTIYTPPDGGGTPEEEEEEEKEEKESAPGQAMMDSHWANYYDDAVESLYNATRALPWEGSITGINLVGCDGRCPRIGEHINIHGLKPKWASMNALIQGIGIDYDSGIMSITTGPPTHLSIQDLIDLNKGLQNQQEQTHTEEEKKKEDTLEQSSGWGWEIEMPEKKKKRPIAPGIGPMSREAAPTEVPIKKIDWVAQPLYDDEQKITGVRIYGGYVCINTDRYITYDGSDKDAEGWIELSISSGTIYLNFNIDKDETVSPLYITATRGRRQNFNGREAWLASHNPEHGIPESLPGFYSIPICTIDGDTLIQHQLGMVVINYFQASTPLSAGP